VTDYRVSKDQFLSLSEEFNLVPVWTEVVADLETPVSAYMKLAGVDSDNPDQYSFLLESVEHGERWGRYSFIGLDPFLVMTSKNGKVTFAGSTPGKHLPGNPLEVLREILADLSAPNLPGLPPLFSGAVGYLGYDLVSYLESLPSAAESDVSTPELMLMFPRTILAFDHLRQKIVVVRNVLKGEDYDQALVRTDEIIARLGRSLNYAPLQTNSPESPPVIPGSTMTKDQYCEAVTAAKQYILAGDIFQVVLSHRLSTELKAQPFDVYRTLRLVNPSPYMFFFQHPEITIFGSSPEPLIMVDGRDVKQRPIAGTRPRGSSEAEDAGIEKEFRQDAKEVAEHIMLVDLARNDIGRVCDYGSVHVEELMGVERYSHVMHMVSQVAGRLREDATALDALYASFPAGTVSGAPKIRAMEIIDELEPTKRGPYAGVVGYFDLSGKLDTCIALRTAYVVNGVIHIQAGAGIVADSDPEVEWTETLNKAGALLTAVAMAEANRTK